jgi:G6PDH family F420-dependent oxidoreductase
VQIIKELFSGDYITRQGEFYDVDSAKLYDLPAEPVPIGIAASGGQSAELAAQFADVLVINEPMPEVVQQFNAAGGQGKPVYGQLPIAYDTDPEAAKQRAHTLWRWASVGGWKVMAELPSPVNFAAAATTVRPEDVAKSVPCGNDVDAVVQGVKKFTDAGYTHVALVQIGHDQQQPFFDWAEKELLPALRNL